MRPVTDGHLAPWEMSDPVATVDPVNASDEDNVPQLERVESAVFSADTARFLAKAEETPIAIYQGGKLVMVVAGLAALDASASRAEKPRGPCP